MKFQSVLWITMALQMLFGWILKPSGFDFGRFRSLQTAASGWKTTHLEKIRLQDLFWWLGRRAADQQRDRETERQRDRESRPNHMSNLRDSGRPMISDDVGRFAGGLHSVCFFVLIWEGFGGVSGWFWSSKTTWKSTFGVLFGRSFFASVFGWILGGPEPRKS